MNINCAPMHSDLSQAERDDVMYRFKTGKVSVLVATDIVARGIDIDDILCVINYDVPHDAEDYVHTFVSENDMRYFSDIERFLEREITKNELPEELGSGPEYRASGPRKQTRGRGGQHRNGKRRGNSNKPKTTPENSKTVDGKQNDKPTEGLKDSKAANGTQESGNKAKHRRHRPRGKCRKTSGDTTKTPPAVS